MMISLAFGLVRVPDPSGHTISLNCVTAPRRWTRKSPEKVHALLERLAGRFGPTKTLSL